MSLKSIFNLTLTNDGKRYNTGDISEKTGLQKQPDGSWAPPKGSNAGKQEADLRKAAMNGGTKEKKALFKFEAENADDEQLKHVLASKNQPADRIEMYQAELEKRNSKSGIPHKTTKAKFDEYGLPDNETIAMKDKFLKKENVKDPDKLTNAEFNALAKKLDSELGIGNMELAQELLVTPAENPYALSKEEKNEAMKNPKTRLSQKYDEVIKSKKGTPQYNTALEEYTKERELYKNSQGVEALKEFPVVPISKDSACSRLTADTKIRLKKKLTIDRVYQIGEKSEKTGKIKVANGKWVDPKKVKNTTKEADNKSMRIKNGLKKTEEITDYLSDKLGKMGFKTKTDYSGMSGSQYITITNYSEMTGKESDYNGEELKIRISNHDLPPSYDGLHGYHDIDIMSEGKERGGNTGNATYYENVINKLNEQILKTKKEEIKKTKENKSKENKIAAESLPSWILEEKSLRERLNNTSDINTRFVLMTFINYDKKERAKKIQNAIEATKNDKNSSYYQVFKEIGLI